MRVWLIGVVCWIGGCSCAPEDHTDAGHDAHVRDTAWAYDDANADTDVDSGPCVPGLPDCLNDDDCLRWGVRVAPAGTFPVTLCTPGGGSCTLGETGCVTHDTHTTCSCGIQVCRGGQICVSDTPGGDPRCVQQCDGH